MKIVQANLQHDYGGAEIHVRMLSRGLQQRGHEVRLLCHPDGALYANALQDGVCTLPLRVRNQLAPLAALRLSALLRRLRPDILHLHTPKDYVCGMAAARLAQVPVVVLTRHMLLPLKPLMRAVYRQADAIVCLSQGVRTLLRTQSIPAEKLRLLYGAINLTPFETSLAASSQTSFDAASLARLREEWRVPPGALLIGCVGRLVPGKGQEWLLDAFARMVSSGKKDQIGCHLILIGDGPTRSALKAQTARLRLADRVCFAGFREDIPRVLAALDVVVMPSTTPELLPLSVIEAMAAGRAVIAADVGGVHEIVSDANLGRLAAAGDTEALAAALHDLLANAPLRQRLGAAAATHVRARFSLSRLLDDTEALYSQLLSYSSSGLSASGTGASEASF